MRQHIAQFFQLKGYLVDGLKMNRRCLEVRVRIASPTARCPDCNRVCRRVHQRHLRRVLHTSSGGNKVVLIMHKRRFRCRCGRIFTEIPPGMKRYGRRTRFHRQQILQDLVEMGFRSAGTRNGVSETTARSDLLSAPIEKGVIWPSRGGIRLGLDGHSVRGNRMAMTVCELTRKRVMAVLPDDHKDTLKAFLGSVPREITPRITEACIDLEWGYRNAIQETLPHTRVVADHFHVIRLANDLIDEVRRVLQDGDHPIPKKIWLKNKEHLSSWEFERLVAWGDRYPKLFTLWRLKEDLRRMYDQHNRRMAAYRLGKIISDYEKMESGFARAFGRTLTRWRVEILNFFDSRTTNAMVEGKHRRFKAIQRASYGFRNIQSYIAKIMLASVPLALVLNHTIYR